MKTRPKILLVDDDENIRKTLADILRLEGCEVATAENGAAGIAEAAGNFVNVALIDLVLPDMPGIEVMESIKAHSPLTEAIREPLKTAVSHFARRRERPQPLHGRMRVRKDRFSGLLYGFLPPADATSLR